MNPLPILSSALLCRDELSSSAVPVALLLRKKTFYKLKLQLSVIVLTNSIH